jgi:hypothetical protein
MPDLMRRLTLLLLIAAAAAGTACASASARSFTEHAQQGFTASDLTFDRDSDFHYSNLHLSIVRGGTIVFYGPISDRCGRCPVQPAGGAEGGALAVRDLDGGGEPEVIVDLFTGGAHCCTDSLIFRYEPATNTYSSLFHGWGNRGYRVHDIDGDGVPELISGDDRFTDIFGPYATSVVPERIWRLGAGRLVDVTRHFRSREARGARRLYAQFRREVRRHRWLYARNILAAYAAQAYVSGGRRTADERVRRALHHRWLRHERGGDTWPVGRAYVRLLGRTLRRYGYT